MGMGVVASLLLLMACANGVFAMKNVAASSIRAAAAAAPQPSGSDLNTYAVTAHDIQLTRTAHSGRSGTTRVKMQLTAEQLQQAVPVITTAKTGLVHDVLDAWSFFKVRQLDRTITRA